MPLLLLNTKVFQTRVKLDIKREMPRGLFLVFFQATGFARREGFAGARVNPWWAVGPARARRVPARKVRMAGKNGRVGLAGASFPGSKVTRVLHSGALGFFPAD